MTDLDAVSFSARMKVLLQALSQVRKLPSSERLYHLLVPLEAVRYSEFAYWRTIQERLQFSPKRALDVSSPFMMAYLLRRDGVIVIKTDINRAEARNCSEKAGIPFVNLDALHLPFSSNSFDFCYSISALEHLYAGHDSAVTEILRVTKPGGLVYITLPVAPRASEEWIDKDPYGSQMQLENRYFFQHRFSPEQAIRLVKEHEKRATCLFLDLFWERYPGEYDGLVQKLQSLPKGQPIQYRLSRHIRRAWLNFRYGLCGLVGEPNVGTNCKTYGNLHAVLRKR